LFLFSLPAEGLVNRVFLSFVKGMDLSLKIKAEWRPL
jgi:hypothetical protein